MDDLARAVTMLGCDVWLDQSLSGGQVWWNVILRQVQLCDAFVAVVSPAMVRSPACAAELHYAQSLDKTLLPVSVRPVPPELLSPTVSRFHIVDLTTDDQDAAYRLAAAVHQLAPSPPLPALLPEPPAAPMSYLATLSETATAATLTLDQQLALVVRLEEAATTPSEAALAVEIAEILYARRDLYHQPARRLEQLLGRHRDRGAHAGDTAGTEQPLAQPAAGVPRNSARMLSGNANERVLEVSLDSGDTVTVRLVYPSGLADNEVYVDGQLVPHIARPQLTRSGFKFGLLDRKAFIRVRGWNQIKGLSLFVDGAVLYSDGMD